MQARQLLAGAGICRYADVYAPEQIKQINNAIDGVLAERAGEQRSYVRVDEMLKLGIFDTILSPRMRSLLLGLMPDPVFYHFHIYEIAANAASSHIFSETLRGWHRDADSALVDNDPTHVSVFVYLTDVGPQDGAFQFAPGDPNRWLTGSTPVVTATGESGSTFAWHRSFYHRASPNRGPVRRRLLKISVQRNQYRSRHLQNENFQALSAEIRPGDLLMDILLGRYAGQQPPEIANPNPLPPLPYEPNDVMALPAQELISAQLRQRARAIKQHLMGQSGPIDAGYD